MAGKMLPWRKKEAKLRLMTQFLKALAAAKRFWDYRKVQKKSGVSVEITGTCNAKCYYCQVGYDNVNHVKSMKKPYLSIDDFRETVRYLKAHEFLKKGDRLVLYAWNEPFLHPEFSEIIKVGREEDCLMSLSTNASVRPKLSDDFDATYIGNVSLSMPGFSQASYDKIHQFDFERITLTHGSPSICGTPRRLLSSLSSDSQLTCHFGRKGTKKIRHISTFSEKK